MENERLQIGYLQVFKSLEITDSFTLRSLSDRTKAVTFDLSGITSGQTRSLTIPNKSGTIALLDDISGGVSAIGTSAADVFSVSGSDLVADDGGTVDNADPFIKWDDTNSKLVYANPLSRPSGEFYVGLAPTTTALGTNAVNIQAARTGATRVASGNSSVAIGDVTASGVQSVAIGIGCFAANYAVSIGRNVTANSGNCIAIGRDSSASGDGSVCLGAFNITSTLSSIAIGGRSLADRQGMLAHSNGRFSANGDAQRIRAVLRCNTTTDSAVEMALNGSTTYLTIPSGKVIFCTIKVVGVKSDGSAVATYERQYAAKNVTATSSEVFAPVTIGSDNPSGTSLDITTQDVGDYISIKVTGISSETWRWVASVDAVEVAYGS